MPKQTIRVYWSDVSILEAGLQCMEILLKEEVGDWQFFINTVGSALPGRYGITSCGVFKAGIQNWKGFCIKNNCSQMKLLNFENWTNGEPQ